MSSDRDELMVRLHPYGMASTLIRGGIAIGVYEAVKDRVINKVRAFVDQDFFFDEEAPHSPGYVEAVIKLSESGKNALEGSILWLVKVGAITNSQADAFRTFQRSRHQFAHQMLREAIEPTKHLGRADYVGLLDFARAVELFWARVEIDIRGEMDSSSISDDDIGLPYWELLFLMCESIEAAESLLLHATTLVEQSAWPTTSS